MSVIPEHDNYAYPSVNFDILRQSHIGKQRQQHTRPRGDVALSKGGEDESDGNCDDQTVN